MPDSPAVSVGEPPTPEGWTILHCGLDVKAGNALVHGPDVPPERPVRVAPVGGTGVRLTDEEAKAGVYALGKAYGGNLISGPQHSLYNKLGKLLAASIGEGYE